ncbi:hypothetical protein, partial [Rhodoplanes roseus]
HHPLGSSIMKQREFTKCLRCGKGVMHAGAITFFRISIERLVVDLGAVRRQHGLELQIGALAQHMGPDEDIAKPLLPAVAGLVCESCAMADDTLFDLWSKVTEAAEPEDAGS